MIGTVGLVAAALAASGGAILLIWRQWRDGRAGPTRLGAPAGLVALATLLWILAFGAEIGVPLMLECWALTGFAFVLTRLDLRPARAPKERLVEHQAASSRAWLRGVARALSGGVLGFAAAMGIGVAIATRAPGAEQTRLILAGLIVPSLWAIFIGWLVVGRRLLLPTLALGSLAGLGFGIATLGAA